MSGFLGFIVSFPTLLHSAIIFGTVIMMKPHWDLNPSCFASFGPFLSAI